MAKGKKEADAEVAETKKRTMKLVTKTFDEIVGLQRPYQIMIVKTLITHLDLRRDEIFEWREDY